MEYSGVLRSGVERSTVPQSGVERFGRRIAPDVVEDERNPGYVWIQVKREVYEDLERIRREVGLGNVNDVIALMLLNWGGENG